MAIGITELMDVLQKSGLPFGDALTMQNQPEVAIREGIAPHVPRPQTRTPQLRSGYKAAIDKIASLDQRLGSLYGDPTSKLFIENPLARERLKETPIGTGYKVAGGIQKQIQQEEQGAERQQEQDINTAVKTYKELASMQAREEKRIEKETKKAGGKAGGAAGVKVSTKEKIAGFYDANAAKYWTNIKEADFKRLWVENMLEGGSIPKGGFTIEDVKKNYESWKKYEVPRIETKKLKESVKKSIERKELKKAERQSVF